jgi:hypothetical protein
MFNAVKLTAVGNILQLGSSKQRKPFLHLSFNSESFNIVDS